MLMKKEINEVIEAIEVGEVIPKQVMIAELWKVMVLIEIRDQLDRLGEIIMDFQAERLRAQVKMIQEIESEDIMKVKNKKTGEVYEGSLGIGDKSLSAFTARALMSLGVVEEIPVPASPEQVEKANEDFEKSVNDKAAADQDQPAADQDQAAADQAQETANQAQEAAGQAQEAASQAQETADQAQAAANLAAQKAAEKAAADEARAKLDQSQKN